MCGRYYIPNAALLMATLPGVHFQWEPYLLNYNVAPTQPVPVVRQTGSAPEGVMMRWGLIPFFAHGVPGKYSTINASIERLQSGPAWRGCWLKGQRVLMMAGGFYEWHLDEQGEKHPYFIHLPDRPVFAFAGLWDHSVRSDGLEIDSCAIVTLQGNALLHRLHNTGAHPHRMPAILRQEDYSTWLLGSQDQANAVLQAYPEDQMQAYRVSRRVNSPRNNDEDLILPVEESLRQGPLSDELAGVSEPSARSPAVLPTPALFSKH